MNKCSVSIDFETDRQELTLKYLGNYFDNAKLGVDPDKYLAMCEALGDTPDLDKLPPNWDSFPWYVHTSMEIFNALPDTYSGGMSPVFTGKNYSSLPVMYDLYLVGDEDKMKIFEVLRFLDNRAREQAIKEAKKAAKQSSK